MTTGERKAELMQDLQTLAVRIREGGPDLEGARAEFDAKMAEVERIQSDAYAAAERVETSESTRDSRDIDRGQPPATAVDDTEPQPPRNTARGVLWRVRDIARQLGYPPVGAVHGRALDNLNIWERVLSNWSISPEQIQDLNRQLDAFEIAAHVRARSERQEREREARVQLPDPMAAVHAKALAEAARQATYRASTEGRLEAIEAVLVEIRDALQVRQS